MRHNEMSGSYSARPFLLAGVLGPADQYFERQNGWGAIEWESMYMHRECEAMRSEFELNNINKNNGENSENNYFPEGRPARCVQIKIPDGHL